MFNARRAEVADRIIDPGTKAEQCDAHAVADDAVSNGGADDQGTLHFFC